MPRALVGTVGHVDHGKTSLVQALTGIDCDRLAEEKARGITIDLGFAHLVEDGYEIGFVDVPGHEHFLHNALAGLGGIQIALLVVAADEGIKPQTREHLSICRLLGIRSALVAITKSELVTPDLRRVLELEIDDLLADGPFRGAPVLAVSARTGDRLGRLKAELFRLAGRFGNRDDPEGPARLPIDRAFHRLGLGVIVTGTLASGRIRTDDELELMPGGESVRVRRIEVYGRVRDQAGVGERTSLQISGVSLAGVRRGVQAGTPGAYTRATTICARMTLLPTAPPLSQAPLAVGIHIYSQKVLGRARALEPGRLLPGHTGVVQIFLYGPAVTVRGDRFILRRQSPVETLGGGEVLDPFWKPRRRTALRPALAAVTGEVRDALALWIDDSGTSGLLEGEMALRTGRSTAALRSDLELVSATGSVREARGSGLWISKKAYDAVAQRAVAFLQDHFRRNPISAGASRAEMVRRILRGGAGPLADAYIAWLAEDRVLATDRESVTLFQHIVQLDEIEKRVAQSVLDRFETAGLQPLAVDDLSACAPAKRELDRALAFLVQTASVVCLDAGTFLSARAVECLDYELRRSAGPRFTVGQFRERFGLTRKWAIPVLRYLDSKGVTRRVGDSREVVRGKVPSPEPPRSRPSGGEP